MSTGMSDEELYNIAKKRVEEKKGFFIQDKPYYTRASKLPDIKLRTREGSPHIVRCVEKTLSRFCRFSSMFLKHSKVRSA